nr:hypothetical protein [Haladaptatus sp. R4]
MDLDDFAFGHGADDFSVRLFNLRFDIVFRECDDEPGSHVEGAVHLLVEDVALAVRELVVVVVDLRGGINRWRR